jgi:hypothetical protein
MDSFPPAPCRLVVYFAREAPIGVVLRRGPSAWARLSVWHTDTDAFKHGQWFRGRVYERRCDVSPDGALFVYFARKSTNRPPRDSWVAISRPPFFTALALWFIGTTYCAGGFFPDRRSVWGVGPAPPDQGELPRWLTHAADPRYIDGTNEWSDRTVYINRLLRDGWEPVPRELIATWDRRHRQEPLVFYYGVPYNETWERRHPQEPLTLVMAYRGDDLEAHGGRHVMEYAVRRESGEVIPLGRATWADWDQHGRLILAQHGRLWQWQDGGLRELADFNPQVPEPRPAPPQAYGWPEPPARRSGPGRTRGKRGWH